VNIDFKDIPAKAVPFVIFITAAVAFGEISIRMPMDSIPKAFTATVMSGFTIISSIMFFSKVIFNYPKLHKLDFD
jgi:hypothetical protein